MRTAARILCVFCTSLILQNLFFSPPPVRTVLRVTKHLLCINALSKIGANISKLGISKELRSVLSPKEHVLRSIGGWQPNYFAATASGHPSLRTISPAAVTGGTPSSWTEAR